LHHLDKNLDVFQQGLKIISIQTLKQPIFKDIISKLFTYLKFSCRKAFLEY